MFLHLQLELSRLDIFVVPTDKNLNEGSQGVIGMYFEKCLPLCTD
jgi:hypothetical protein